MRFDPRRLRSGEWLAAAGTVAMIVALFALHWYGRPAGPPVPGPAFPRDGWQGVSHLRWLLVITIALGVAVVVAQVGFRAPAVPACLDTVTTVIALVAVLWLLYRVVINPPPHQLAGAWVGLAGTCALMAGSFLALRQEGLGPRDGPQHIPVVALGVSRRA